MKLMFTCIRSAFYLCAQGAFTGVLERILLFPDENSLLSISHAPGGLWTSRESLVLILEAHYP